MLRSLQTTDPLTAWSRIHPELLKIGVGTRIAGQDINQLLHVFCTGMKAAKDTLLWAQQEGMLTAHFEDVPTSYSLTDAGRKWQSAK